MPAVHPSIFPCPGVCVWRGVCLYKWSVYVGGNLQGGAGMGQHLFALVHVVTSDIAQDEDDPEESHSTQHLHGDPQLARAQFLGEPRENHQ